MVVLEATLRLSSLSTQDFLMLHTTFEIFANKKSSFDCEKIGSRFDRFTDESDREMRITQFREARGCGGLPSNRHFNFPPFILKTCPCTYQNRTRFGNIWALFDQYERHGTLPFEGPLTAQPAQILDAFDVLRGLKDAHESK